MWTVRLRSKIRREMIEKEENEIKYCIDCFNQGLQGKKANQIEKNRVWNVLKILNNDDEERKKMQLIF